MKACSRCKQVKALSEYGKNSASKDGLKYWCNDCRKIEREQSKAERSEYNRKYRTSHQKEANERNRQWRKRNRPALVAASNRYRGRKRNQSGYVPKGFLEAMRRVYGYVCAHPDCDVRTDLHIDHVMPLALGGLDALDNYQFLCAWHNKSKGATYVDYRSAVLHDTLTGS